MNQIDPVQLMLDVIKENSPNSAWVGSPLESFRSVANTNRGDIGEEFVARYLKFLELDVVKAPSRNREWDVEILGQKLEVKTASQDSSGYFQFNHIRLDRKYGYLLCLAVRPSELLFGLWSKGEVAEGIAGTLVRMAEGQSITFKLTKNPVQLEPVQNLANALRKRLG
ncbi:MAG: hypothetical protein FD175_988 [Beijerinckiaceae bacterium]|nr:MAG: hypothetical protein FD175_988 [Beijerinckiaceae bacterium]